MGVASGLFWLIATLECLAALFIWSGNPTAREVGQIAPNSHTTSQPFGIRWQSIITASVTFSAAISSIAAAVAAYYASEQAYAAREANSVVQRPFITVSELNVVEDFDIADGANERVFSGWSFQPVIENSGATPSKHLRVLPLLILDTHRNLQPDDPNKMFDRLSMHAALLSIGPHAKVILNATRELGLKLQSYEIGEIAAGRLGPVYAIGSIRYFDNFKDSPEHITRYCFRIEPEGDGGQKTTVINYSPCRLWNCFDEECEYHRQEFDRLVAASTKPSPQ